MTSEDPNLMEGEILRENEPIASPTASKPTTPGLKLPKISLGKLKTLKLPKLKFIAIALFVLLVCLLALVFVSKRNNTPPEVVQNISVASPTVQSPKPDAQKKLEDSLDLYDKAVDDTTITIVDFQAPKVDLEPKF